MSDTQRKLAVVTGASTGIGLELARECAKNNFDLIIAANETEIESAAEELRRDGGTVDVVQADLATTEGVTRGRRSPQNRSDRTVLTKGMRHGRAKFLHYFPTGFR